MRLAVVTDIRSQCDEVVEACVTHARRKAPAPGYRGDIEPDVIVIKLSDLPPRLNTFCRSDGLRLGHPVFLKPEYDWAARELSALGDLGIARLSHAEVIYYCCDGISNHDADMFVLYKKLRELNPYADIRLSMIGVGDPIAESVGKTMAIDRVKAMHDVIEVTDRLGAGSGLGLSDMLRRLFWQQNGHHYSGFVNFVILVLLKEIGRFERADKKSVERFFERNFGRLLPVGPFAIAMSWECGYLDMLQSGVASDGGAAFSEFRINTKGRSLLARIHPDVLSPRTLSAVNAAFREPAKAATYLDDLLTSLAAKQAEHERALPPVENERREQGTEP
jgi:hypothetical protein